MGDQGAHVLFGSQHPARPAAVDGSGQQRRSASVEEHRLGVPTIEAQPAEQHRPCRGGVGVLHDEGPVLPAELSIPQPSGDERGMGFEGLDDGEKLSRIAGGTNSQLFAHV